MLVDVSVCTHSLFDLQVLTVCTAQPLPFPQSSPWSCAESKMARQRRLKTNWFDIQIMQQQNKQFWFVCRAQPLPFPQLLTLVVCSLAAGT